MQSNPSSSCLQVDVVATGLLAIGLTKGDRLCLWGPNSYEWVLMQFATAKAGIILVSPTADSNTTSSVIDYVNEKGKYCRKGLVDCFHCAG